MKNMNLSNEISDFVDRILKEAGCTSRHEQTSTHSTTTINGKIYHGNNIYTTDNKVIVDGVVVDIIGGRKKHKDLVDRAAEAYETTDHPTELKSDLRYADAKETTKAKSHGLKLRELNDD